MEPLAEPDNPFRVIACRSLCHERRDDAYFAPGLTIADCLRRLGWTPEHVQAARVTINGQLVLDAEWLTAAPKAGQSVVVRVIPTGGGDGGKQVGQLIALVALTVAAAFVAGGGLAPVLGAAFKSGLISYSAAAAISIGGSLALNGHIPPPLPRRVPLPLRDFQEAA